MSKIKWTNELLAECRNEKKVPFGEMSAEAQKVITSLNHIDNMLVGFLNINGFFSYGCAPWTISDKFVFCISPEWTPEELDGKLVCRKCGKEFSYTEILYSEEIGPHCDGCDDFNQKTDIQNEPASKDKCPKCGSGNVDVAGTEQRCMDCGNQATLPASDTPRTDAIMEAMPLREVWPDDLDKLADFARTLERENAQLRNDLDASYREAVELTKDKDTLSSHLECLRGDIAKLRKQLAEAQASANMEESENLHLMMNARAEIERLGQNYRELKAWAERQEANGSVYEDIPEEYIGNSGGA